MLSKILTSNIIGIDAFLQDPQKVLNCVEDGVLAVFAKNTPAFYAITPTRLAKLLELETKLAHPKNDVTLNSQFYDEPIDTPVAAPISKFAMYAGWQPDANFQQLAALWGVVLLQPVTPEELAAFITYWQVEGKVFHHVQWQQKLARSVQINRISSKNRQSQRDCNALSEPDTHIPPGFRG